MNYKEKIFYDILKDLKIKKLENYYNQACSNQYQSQINSYSGNVINNKPFNSQVHISDCNKPINFQNLLEGDYYSFENFLNRSGIKNFDNELFNNLIVKYNSEISIILKFFLKCLLNNYKFDGSQIKLTCIKPEIKDLILRCRLANTIETFIGLIIKDEIKFELDIISGFYDKPYLEELYM